MNILHLHESTDVHGGAEVYIGQLQYFLKQNACNTFWIGIRQYNKYYHLTEPGSEIAHHLKFKELIKYLDSFILEKKIDIINIHSVFSVSVVRYCLNVKPVIKFSHSPLMVCPGRDKFWRYSEKICDIKYGLHCFMHIYTEGCANRHPKRVVKAWREVNFEIKQASRKYRKIIVMSDYIRGGLLECGVPADRILLNPYFTAHTDILPGVIPIGQKRLLFIGRLISSKGPHILIKAVSGILKANQDVFLDIVGDGLMMKELQEQVISEGLQDKVVFHGWKSREATQPILDSCYMLVFPSVYPEAFGIVGIEALMQGKPVVAFDVGGVGTWLSNNKTGYLVPRADVAVMAQKIQQLLDNPSLYAAMSSNAREEAVSRFTPDVHMKTLIDLYKSCL